MHAVTVEYKRDRSCFVGVSEKLVKTFKNQEEVKAIDVSYGRDQHAFLSWSGSPLTLTDGSGNRMQINGLYASKLGLKDGDEVCVQVVNQVASCLSVFVEPLSVDDWEILKSYATFIENHLLDQVRVVWTGQILPMWVEKSLCVFVKIGDMVPRGKCTMLVNDTEVMVAPKERQGQSNRERHKKQFPRSKTLDSACLDDKTAEDVRIMKRPLSDPQKEKTNLSKNGIDNRPSNFSNMLQSIKARGSIMSRQSVFLSSVTSYFTSILPNQDLGHIGSPVDGVPKSTRGNVPDIFYDHAVTLRVAPMKNPTIGERNTVMKSIHKKSRKNNSVVKEHLIDPCEIALHQPSTIFVNAVNVHLPVLEESETLPKVFYATIKKQPSPSESRTEKSDSFNRKKSLETKNEKKEEARKESKPETKSKKSPDSPKKPLIEPPPPTVRVVVIDVERDVWASDYREAIARLLSTQPMMKDHAFIPDLLRRLLKLDVSGRVLLKPIKCDANASATTKNLYINPLSQVPHHISHDMIIMAFYEWIKHISSAQCPLVVFSGLLVRFIITREFHLEALLGIKDSAYDSDSPPYTNLHPELIDQFAVNVVTNPSFRELFPACSSTPCRDVSNIDPEVPFLGLSSLGGVGSISAKALNHLRLSLSYEPLSEYLFQDSPGLHNGLLLITGSKGTGKTMLARALCREMAELPSLAHVTIVECKMLKGKRIEVIQKMLEQCFEEAAWRQPSIILLDDLDHVTMSANEPEADTSGEAAYSAKVAEVIQLIIKREITNKSRLSVLATSQSLSSLHPSLVTSRGTHYIQKILNIPTPNKVIRKDILKLTLEMKSVVSDGTIEFVDLDRLSSKMEGFVARDLNHIVDRAIHAYMMRIGRALTHGEEITLSAYEFDAAMNGFTPASIRNISLHTAGDLGWEDIGGLQEVKNTLIKTLMWPSKYPRLFANCPLRLRSGLLLYGAPGTGKTLLAGVVAKECRMNFISIKGPELLSKYIGASEQAVRDTFTRAQSAKPCVLFFDEFDSIAPRRGHDNTGVTDRVVNQLLTQLDGVEGLDGVYVLAATSRPDLIDPALLRPGRLDKCLHCGLPDKDDRLEIMHALSRKMCLAPDVDQDKISQLCTHFTGADFKALLYNAQLEAIHEHQDKNIISSFDRASSPKNTEDDVFAPLAIENKQTNSMDEVEEKIVPQMAVAVTRERVRSQKQLVFIPKLDEGIVALSVDMEKKLTKQLEVLNDRQSNGGRYMKSKLVRGRERSLSRTANPMIKVKQAHLINAISKMRPSVSIQERHKYDKIYQNFVKGRGGNFSSQHLQTGRQQKVSLA